MTKVVFRYTCRCCRSLYSAINYLHQYSTETDAGVKEATIDYIAMTNFIEQIRHECEATGNSGDSFSCAKRFCEGFRTDHYKFGV